MKMAPVVHVRVGVFVDAVHVECIQPGVDERCVRWVFVSVYFPMLPDDALLIAFALFAIFSLGTAKVLKPCSELLMGQ